MGFFKNLGVIAKDTALGAATQGLRQSQLSTFNGDFSAEGIMNSLSSMSDPLNLFTSGESIVDTGTNLINDVKSTNFAELYKKQPSKFFGQYNKKKVISISDCANENDNIYINTAEAQTSDEYVLNIPNWGYNDFINERNIFIKHISNGFDEPGWFYFKLFFDFDSNHGLFGGILNNKDDNNAFISINSAYQYLNQVQKFHKYEKLDERMTSLSKFTRLLSFINVNAPWFFTAVKNLSAASNPQIDKITEEKYIEIELNQEAIDMRITTLLSLYKYACYDDINNKEIIPDNLRKFDLCLIVFSAPIKFLHGPKSKKTAIGGANSMSYKLYKFVNCEFNIESIGSYMTNELKSDAPFELGKNTLKINYDKVYEYNMNEYMGLLIGSDGIYMDNPNITIKDMDQLVKESEEFVHNSFSSLFKTKSSYVLGNIRGQDYSIYEPNMSSLSYTRNYTDYAKSKYGLMSGNKNANWILSTGYDVLYKLLGTGYNANANVLKVNGKVIGDGTALNGHGYYRVGSAVWKAKMQRMVNGKGGLSDREYRLTTVGTALETNWAQKLHDMAVNNTNPLGFI